MKARFVICRYGSNVHAGQGKRRHVMRPAMWEHVMQRTKAEDEKRKDKTYGRRARIETENQFRDRERLGSVGDVATYNGGIEEDDTRVK